ncbi:bifunctional ADP-dependent NAD(P)H-hydrate dehydratase/NAD(P)H-hydrate epimerase [Nocardioides sp.]|uniref:bifunctional ADP-dependent NAD(P)H-hydrate dehydratase/NAD(P)H-hydrate epimerase n=1 Tax=Nocardioides sp. TaxID=35761 RepID=UPI002D7EFE9E|nr:bifunctional ADP-dependent NAD(P)H-hydrate dehydratase/NAD(P)H-hydrate epimerase [Nocardioides sp.]HET8959956.1 bifunctional ADP-dependent NAD(P)H-hydrate dehydratase/NAD(P)H-hydrate epimerase [Nocardioides sp.]
MRRAHTVEQVRESERALMATLPDGALMQRAAAGLAYAVLDLLGSAYGRRVLLLVGSGDNGGDTLYAGAMLARRGCAVEARLLSERVHEGGLAALRAAGGRVVSSTPSQGPASGARPGVARPEVVVDGIVGIGGRPGLRPDAVEALASVEGVPVVAVDVPSGVGVDSGELDGPHVEAAVTVTFGTHKIAHLVDPAAAACGVVHLVDIGLDLPEARVESLQPSDVARLLPRPDPQAHKYTRGVVGVRAGSPQYPGAGLLCVQGAATGLCGMVRYVGDGRLAERVRATHPDVVGEGRVQAWAVGSGGGEGAGDELKAAVADGVPVVVDADALTHVTGPLGVPAVLTPHAGELAAMAGADRADVEARPLAHALAAAARYDAAVLLKGRHTLVATPQGAVRVTTTGTPWLATAGAGDVLTGVIGSLLAAGLAPYDAASVGSWLHGAAATLAANDGPIVAGAVARAIPEVVRLVTWGH